MVCLYCGGSELYIYGCPYTYICKKCKTGCTIEASYKLQKAIIEYRNTNTNTNTNTKPK